MRTVALVVLLLACTAMGTSVQQQIEALLQTGTKASDAIDAVFDLLNDLKQSNVDAQVASDEKNKTDELIGSTTISKFTEIMNMNKKLFTQAINNRQRFESELADTKNYLAWNELRQDEVARKSEVLLDNQCYSNQLFVRSIKGNQEALEVVKLLKQDVAGYVSGGESFELNQMSKSDVSSIADKLKKYSNIFNKQEINTFLELAAEENLEQDAEHQFGVRQGTVAERVLSVLEDLEIRLADSYSNLEQNEINAAWELAGWLASSRAEIEYLAQEHERKSTYADRCATQIQAALAQQAKSNIILKESQDALDQAISDLENKREVYADEKTKRDQENAILDEVVTMFKQQVSHWSGRF